MDITFRKATLADLEVLIQLRFELLTDYERRDLTEAETTAIEAHLRDYIPREIGHHFVAYLAEADGMVISCVYEVLVEKPANVSFINGRTANVFNVFTYPDYRRQGIAQQLMEMVIEDAKAMGLSCLDLTSSNSGRPLYEKLGFLRCDDDKHTDMRLHLLEA